MSQLRSSIESIYYRKIASHQQSVVGIHPVVDGVNRSFRVSECVDFVESILGATDMMVYVATDVMVYVATDVMVFVATDVAVST